MRRDDPNRPYDWQDRLVIGGSVICCLIFLILLWDSARSYGLR